MANIIIKLKHYKNVCFRSNVLYWNLLVKSKEADHILAKIVYVHLLYMLT